MTSSMYVFGCVRKMVVGDSVKCTKMASVHEKTVAQASVISHAGFTVLGTVNTSSSSDLRPQFDFKANLFNK